MGYEPRKIQWEEREDKDYWAKTTQNMKQLSDKLQWGWKNTHILNKTIEAAAFTVSAAATHKR